MSAVLELRGAFKAYGEHAALVDFSLEVEPGQIHAIVGLNGAGKTTAMKALVGQTLLDGGQTFVLGTHVADASAPQLAQLGYVVDELFGYPELTVLANIAFAARLRGLTSDDAVAASHAWVERLDLHRWAHTRARALSLGNRQRLGFACASAHRPSVLILDEPTNALDPAGVLLLRDALLDAAARGAGVLVSSHHLDEVSRIAHLITVVHAGQVIGTLEPGQVDLERRFFEAVRAWDEAARAGGAA
jgi:ABC-2 type transport system ATP-binding protein